MTKSENGKGSVGNHELKDFEDILLKLIDELPHEELDKMKTLTEPDGRGSSPMWYAVWIGSKALVDKLMEIKATFDHPDLGSSFARR